PDGLVATATRSSIAHDGRTATAARPSSDGGPGPNSLHVRVSLCISICLSLPVCLSARHPLWAVFRWRSLFLWTRLGVSALGTSVIPATRRESQNVPPFFCLGGFGAKWRLFLLGRD